MMTIPLCIVHSEILDFWRQPLTIFHLCLIPLRTVSFYLSLPGCILISADKTLRISPGWLRASDNALLPKWMTPRLSTSLSAPVSLYFSWLSYRVHSDQWILYLLLVVFVPRIRLSHSMKSHQSPHVRCRQEDRLATCAARDGALSSNKWCHTMRWCAILIFKTNEVALVHRYCHSPSATSKRDCSGDSPTANETTMQVASLRNTPPRSPSKRRLSPLALSLSLLISLPSHLLNIDWLTFHYSLLYTLIFWSWIKSALASVHSNNCPGFTLYPGTDLICLCCFFLSCVVSQALFSLLSQQVAPFTFPCVFFSYAFSFANLDSYGCRHRLRCEMWHLNSGQRIIGPVGLTLDCRWIFCFMQFLWWYSLGQSLVLGNRRETWTLLSAV